jgi:30S ribosomal protein S31
MENGKWDAEVDLALRSIPIFHFPFSISQGVMGKGDKRTKKGKIYRGSYGKRRPRKLKPAAKKAAPKR